MKIETGIDDVECEDYEALGGLRILILTGGCSPEVRLYADEALKLAEVLIKWAEGES